MNCWGYKKCGREEGGENASQLGVCPAYPNHGKNCWMVAGTFCNGEPGGTTARELSSCLSCDWHKKVHLNAMFKATVQVAMVARASREQEE